MISKVFNLFSISPQLLITCFRCNSLISFNFWVLLYSVSSNLGWIRGILAIALFDPTVGVIVVVEVELWHHITLRLPLQINAAMQLEQLTNPKSKSTVQVQSPSPGWKLGFHQNLIFQPPSHSEKFQTSWGWAVQSSAPVGISVAW